MHPEIDRYAHLDSFLHRWDPRWKLASLGALLLSFAAAPLPAGTAPSRSRDLPHALVSLAAALALVQLSRIPLSFLLRRLLPAGFFLAFFLALYTWVGAGGDGFLFEVRFSPVRFQTACIIALRGLAILLLVFPMFGTSRFDVTMKALRALRLPAPFVQLTVFSYRYLFVYADELRRMRTSMRARGFRGRPPLHALRTAGNAIGMLLVRSVERTEGIRDAMVSRGYCGDFRTFQDFATRPKDVALAAAFGGAAVLLLALRFAP